MSPYEEQSLVIAKNTLWVYFGGDLIAFGALLVAALGGYLAYVNLLKISQQLKITRWNSLLSFEQDMSTRRAKFLEIAVRLPSITDDQSRTMTRLMFEEAKQNYFNSLDRLASCIMNGQFPDEEMRQDYLESITNTVREHHGDFGTATKYRKVMKLYNKWQDSL